MYILLRLFLLPSSAVVLLNRGMGIANEGSSYCKEKSAVKIFLFPLFFLKKSIMCTVLILVKMPLGFFYFNGFI